MRVLVTGGAGYTGIPLCSALLGAGHHVTLLDNFLFGYEGVLQLVRHPRLEVVKGDIRDENRPYLVRQDAIFHLAAISGYPACEANPHSAKLININATASLARALAPGQLMFFASTTSFYGSSGQLSTEDTLPTPVSLYGVTKRDGEAAVMERERSVALRWATVFGVSPRMRAGLLAHDFVERAVQDRTIVLYDAESRRTFMHIDDLVRGYLFALDNADRMIGGVFNMGSDRLNYTKAEIAEMVQQYVPCEIVRVKTGDTDVRNFLVSFERAKALGYDTTRTLDEGIAELCKLFRFYTPNAFFRPI